MASQQTDTASRTSEMTVILEYAGLQPEFKSSSRSLPWVQDISTTAAASSHTPLLSNVVIHLQGVLLLLQVPFALLATAYRRKRIMEGLTSGDKDLTAQVIQIAEDAARKAADEAAHHAQGQWLSWYEPCILQR